MTMMRGGAQSGPMLEVEAAVARFRSSKLLWDFDELLQACLRLSDTDLPRIARGMHNDATMAAIFAANIISSRGTRTHEHESVYFHAKMLYGRLNLIDPELSSAERLARAKQHFAAAQAFLDNVAPVLGTDKEKSFLKLILTETPVAQQADVVPASIDKIFQLRKLAFPGLASQDCCLQARSYLFYLAQTGSPEAPETLLAWEVLSVILQKDLNPGTPVAAKRYGQALYELYAPALFLSNRILPEGNQVKACELFMDLMQPSQELGFYLHAIYAYHSVVTLFPKRRSMQIPCAVIVYYKIFTLISIQPEAVSPQQLEMFCERLKSYAGLTKDIELKKAIFARWFDFLRLQLIGPHSNDPKKTAEPDVEAGFKEFFEFLAQQGFDPAKPQFFEWYVSILVDLTKHLHSPENKQWLLTQLAALRNSASTLANLAPHVTYAEKALADCEVRSGYLDQVRKGLATYDRLIETSPTAAASEAKLANGALSVSADDWRDGKAAEAEANYQVNFADSGVSNLEPYARAITLFGDAITLGYEEGKLHLALLHLKRSAQKPSDEDLNQGLKNLMEYLGSPDSEPMSVENARLLIDLLSPYQAPAATAPTPQQIQVFQLLKLFELLKMLDLIHGARTVGGIGLISTGFRACFGIANIKLKQKVRKVLLDKFKLVHPEGHYSSKLDTVEQVSDFIRHCYPSFVKYLAGIIDLRARDMAPEYVSWLEDLLKEVEGAVAGFENHTVDTVEVKQVENARDPHNDKYCLLAKLYSDIKKHPQLFRGQEAYFAELSKQAVNKFMLLATAPDPLMLLKVQIPAIQETLQRLVVHNCLDAFDVLYRFHNSGKQTRRGVYLCLKGFLATKDAASAAKRYGLEISVIEARHQRYAKELDYLAERGREYSGLAAWAKKAASKAGNDWNIDKVILQAAAAQDEETQFCREDIQVAMQQTLGVISFSLQGIDRDWIAAKLREPSFNPAAPQGIATMREPAISSGSAAIYSTIAAASSSSSATSPSSTMTVGALMSSSSAVGSSTWVGYKGPSSGSPTYFFGISNSSSVSSSSIISSAVAGSRPSPSLFAQGGAAAGSASSSSLAAAPAGAGPLSGTTPAVTTTPKKDQH